MLLPSVKTKICLQCLFTYLQMNEAESAPAEEVAKVREALGWLEDMVRPTGYAAGTEHLTLERDMSLKMRVMQLQRMFDVIGIKFRLLLSCSCFYYVGAGVYDINSHNASSKLNT